jgi:DNA-binding transcriptional LysR family regulator
MDRFHLMAVYVAVAEEESFAAGARRLGMSPPAVTRAIAALEKRLGVKLLTRTTRYVRATDAGRRYLEHTRRVLADADEADEAAAGVNAAPRGRLTVTAPVLFGRMFVTPGVVDFLRRYPEISVAALLLDRVVNLIEEGIDVGVRIGELPDSSLHAITVGQVHRVVCASPAYFKANGVPRNPADLAAHTIIAASPVSPSIDWKFEGGKKSTTVKLIPRLTVTNNDAAIVAALEGFGITRLMSYQIGPLLASGHLKAILQDSDHSHLPIHILHGEGGRASAKVRVFVDSMVARLRSDKALGYTATH